MKPLRKKNKTPSYFSHDFIIANHGDIVSVFAMIFIGGMGLSVTSPIASLFVSMQHNVSNEQDSTSPSEIMYSTGRYDLLAVVFYTLVCIIIHAVIKEYGFDKITKKLHLPRSSQSKFNESGQLFCFYIASAYWAIYALINEQYLTSLDSMWTEYPHTRMPFWIKTFFIFQISYWVHNYPELYFMKAKKSEIHERVFYSSSYLIGIFAAYFLNFSKLAMILLIIHYITDSFFHFACMMKYYGWNFGARSGFAVYNALYIPARVICTVLSLITFYYGLPQYTIQAMNLAEGNFNTWLIRLNCMLFVFCTQAHMVWTFINYHFNKIRESNSQQMINSTYSTNADFQKRKEKKKPVKTEESPDSSHNNHREVRQRKLKQTSS